MMTYIITPNNNAFSVKEPIFSIHEYNPPGSKSYAVVQIVKHNWSDDWNNISVEYTGEDRMFKATEFLIQLIDAISENPLIIQCDQFGEIRIIKSPKFD